MSFGYSDEVMDHFTGPRNVGVVEGYNGKTLIGEPACGDFLEVTIRVDPALNRLDEVMFRCKGCPAAIATGSVMTELARGKELAEILCMTENDILQVIGGLPEHKIHCSVLSIQGVRDAIADFVVYNNLVQSGKLSDRTQYELFLGNRRISMAPHVCDGTCETRVEE